MLYTHVAILRRHGFDAWVLHQQAPFKPAWLDIDVPVSYLDKPVALPDSSDLLVVPEVLAGSAPARALPGRRVVFVQNAFAILPGLAGAADYRSLGYERAIAVMPHVREVVERHFGVPAPVVPPCIARHFFAEPDTLDRTPHSRRILLAPAKVASPDGDVLRALLKRRAADLPGWSVMELRGFSHREVARLMRGSVFLVNTNLGESFNATVPEAMAAGCIALCYEAYGGRDFLRDGENAHVFPNHYVYPLLERLFDLIDGFETRHDEMAAMRRRAYATAQSFTETQTEQALLEFMAGRAC